MNILATIILSALTAVGSFVGAYKYLPLSVFESPQTNFGSTITTIQGSDTLSNSRTTINDNFSALNSGKFELTDWFATTTATQITDLGTITTGTWNASTLTVPYGGTGSTTLSAYQVLIGNGTGNISVVSGLGSSGQFLTSNGAGAAPTWQTSAIDTAGDYTWTGIHTFSKSLISSGTTTIAASNVNDAALVINGVAYKFPSSNSASSTVLTSDGSGNLIWDVDNQFISSTTIGSSIGEGTYTSVAVPTGTKQIYLLFSTSGSGGCGSMSTNKSQLVLRTVGMNSSVEVTKSATCGSGSVVIDHVASTTSSTLGVVMTEPATSITASCGTAYFYR